MSNWSLDAGKAKQAKQQVETTSGEIRKLLEQYNTAASQEETARKTVLQLQDESTAELEETPLANNRLMYIKAER